jgi:hypothetical protein
MQVDSASPGLHAWASFLFSQWDNEPSAPWGQRASRNWEGGHSLSVVIASSLLFGAAVDAVRKDGVLHSSQEIEERIARMRVRRKVRKARF